MPTLDAALTDAYDRFRRGDLAGAGAIARRLIDAKASDPRLSALAGMVAIHDGNAAGAVRHLRPALAATPDNLSLRTSLAFALVQTGALDEARRVAVVGNAPQLHRIIAFVDQQQGRFDAAMAGYRRVLAGFPEDFESWSNLGLILLRRGETQEAETALRRSVKIQPVQRDAYRGLATLLAESQRYEERRLLMRDAVRSCPSDTMLLIELGLAEGAMDDFAAAQAAYQEALRLVPTLPAAYLEFGMMLERLNRLDELDALVAKARAAGCNGPEIDFIEAWALRRRGRFSEARPLAYASVKGLNPSRHAQLIGEIADALGDVDEAFAAFTAMNQASAATSASERARARDFPAEIRATIERLSPATVARWQDVAPAPSLPAPIFIVGFPRSGTTLLDTLLMNAPELQILEECPAMERVESVLGDADRIANLTTEDVEQLRAVYFDTVAELVPSFDSARRIVDKFPTNMVRAALIHRLFPDAKFIFVERHPCDAVLSCFTARFQINSAMVQFHDLDSAAGLYDLALTAWSRASSILPLSVHRVRYERMVEGLEEELRPLLAFLDLPWRDGILDNQRSGSQRGYIATPSYAQVTQPIYTSALNRWVRYRQHLAPVLPVLAPWVKSFGYTL